MFKHKLIIGLLFLIPFWGFTQANPIRIDAKNEPLNSVLLRLRDQHNFQLSYSESELSRYKVTVSKTFTSKEEAIRYLLTDLPLKLKIVGDVFILVPDKKKPKSEEQPLPEIKKKALSQISGQIVEAGSSEPLPFSHVLINNHPMVSDVMGSFNYTASADSSFHVRISHLGYYVYDTILHAASFQQFKLYPSTEKLSEILVQNNVVEKATMVGDRTGKITLNHSISRFLPGQGDNSVFNLLRLMPGIQAAGEQSTDLLIWGSSEGQSLVTFDEFCLFGLKNYNDNISAVNPFLVKNIEVLKGGFDARYGNRVGGLVNITGKNGSLQKPTFSFNINQTTLNGMVEFPLFKKSSLLMAYRQTYYNLYNSDDFNVFAPTRPHKKNNGDKTNDRPLNFDLDVYPDDYRFRDLNLKFSHQFNNGDLFYWSFYGGSDVFSLTTSADLDRQKLVQPNQMQITPITVSYNNAERNAQLGTTLFYSRTWSNRFSSKFIFSNSQFSKELADSIQSKIKKTDRVFKDDLSGTFNQAIERSFKIDNVYHLKKGHQLEFGVGTYRNQAKIGYYNDFRDTISSDTTLFSHNRAMVYFQDNWPIGSRLVLKTGARVNLSNNRVRVHFEPRISGTYKLTENLKINASWGRYNQFIYKIATVDRDQNYTYLWVTSNRDIPVLSATHWVGGITYIKNDFTVNVESYFKQTRNIVQRVLEEPTNFLKPNTNYSFKIGKAKTYGLDVYAKKEFGKHAVWASYSLSQAFESWIIPGTIRYGEEKLAPYHQLHELKVAALFTIKNVYLSTDYVYGSGIQLLHEVFADEVDKVDYNRFDAAITYKFSPKRLNGEVGLSVLNVCDTQNLKYANLRNIKLSQDFGDIRIYSDAAPFTPVLFLKLVF